MSLAVSIFLWLFYPGLFVLDEPLLLMEEGSKEAVASAVPISQQDFGQKQCKQNIHTQQARYGKTETRLLVMVGDDDSLMNRIILQPCKEVGHFRKYIEILFIYAVLFTTPSSVSLPLNMNQSVDNVYIQVCKIQVTFPKFPVFPEIPVSRLLELEGNKLEKGVLHSGFLESYRNFASLYTVSGSEIYK